jgi:YbbR domain-containing protein
VNLRASLTRNWTLKLTSLLLAVILWLMAAAEEPGTTTMPVRIAVQAPPGRTLLHPPEDVTAIVTGPRGDLLRLAPAGLVVIRTLPDSAQRRVELEIGPNDVDIPNGVDVRVHDVHPRRLTLELDAVESRTVPVRPLLRLPSDSSLALAAGILVEPATVVLTGPREQVLRLDTVYTLPLDLDGGSPASQRVRVDTVGFETVRVDPQVVTVRADVGAVAERTLDGVPVQLTSSVSESLRSDVQSVSVVMQGDPSRLAGINADSILVTLAGNSGADGRAGLRVTAPAGVRTRAVPDSVRLVPRAQ